MAVTGDEKLTFELRLLYGNDALAGLLRDVTVTGATYIVARTNTIVNSRRPDPFEPAAVILPYEEYQLLKRPEGDR
jgi:hypothetical protein